MRRVFERARKPEEKEVRRRAILTAARRLMSEVGSIDLSLSELARQSNVSKANIYRYFESREEVLLQVWVEDVRELSEHLDLALARVRKNDARGTAAVIAHAFVARPRLSELTSIVSAIIERNLSVDAIATAKQTLLTVTGRFADLLHRTLPALTLADCGWAASAIAIHVAGLWPGSHPGPAAAQVLARPEFAGMRPNFEGDLKRFVEVTLRGLKGLRRVL
jgi:AcrR family transcriptional regulator